jgi:hypothetical protein
MITINGQAVASFTSLRQICPGLAAGSMFGTLVLSADSIDKFAVYSRVSNAAGAGFSVEGFPANNFSSATTLVTGLRRSAATASAPAYQTNCFVGNLAQVTPEAVPASQEVNLELTQDGAVIGSTVVPVLPGQLVRLLDVFAAAGDASNEYDHASAEFAFPPGGHAGVVSFCTVQDNTSFGADFRIAKEVRGNGPRQVFFDFNSMRETYTSQRTVITGAVLSSLPLAIPAGATANTHVFYFRNPDYLSCRLRDPATHATATGAYGLEMRLLAYGSSAPTLDVIAGGNNITSFSNLYLGDKNDRPGGNNSDYFVQVESNGQNEAASRPYELHCESGSGHTLGELIQTGAAVSF